MKCLLFVCFYRIEGRILAGKYISFILSFGDWVLLGYSKKKTLLTKAVKIKIKLIRSLLVTLLTCNTQLNNNLLGFEYR